MKSQGRYKNALRPENKWLVEEIQKDVDDNWKRLLELCGEK